MNDEQFRALVVELFTMFYAGVEFACECCDEARAWEFCEQNAQMELDGEVSWLTPSRGYALQVAFDLLGAA